MREITLMNPSKETDNKLRWMADVEGAPFALYIPKWRVPEPWPVQVIVAVTDNLRDPQAQTQGRRNLLEQIIAIVKKVKNIPALSGTGH